MDCSREQKVITTWLHVSNLIQNGTRSRLNLPTTSLSRSRSSSVDETPGHNSVSGRVKYGTFIIGYPAVPRDPPVAAI